MRTSALCAATIAALLGLTAAPSSQTASSQTLAFAVTSVKPAPSNTTPIGFSVRGEQVHAAALTLAQIVTDHRPEFEVASLKENLSGIPSGQIKYVPGGRLAVEDATLPMLIEWAYRISEFQLGGIPDGFRNKRFDIQAKAAAQVSEAQVRLMLQVLLENRFGLKLRNEQRQMQHFTLLLNRSDKQLGPGLMKLSGDFDCQKARNTSDPIRPKPGTLVMLAANCGPLATLASVAMSQVRMFVVDRTALSGDWFYRVYFAPLETPRQGGPVNPLETDSSFPVFATAIKDQLGLKLEPAKGPVNVLVVESLHEATRD